MKKIIISFFIILSLAAVSFATAQNDKKTTNNQSNEYKLKKAHEGIECVDCHGNAKVEKYYLINSEPCLSCHGSREDVAALTKQLDANDVNPHRSFHSGTTTECYECHREHKPSRNYCGNCHDTDIWMNPVP